jgi:hypothetical protein
MFENETILRYCIDNHITVAQYFFLYLVARRDYHLPVAESLLKQYVEVVQVFDAKDVGVLERAGFLIDLNNPGHYYPEMFALADKAKDLFVSYSMAEELWEHYPVTFPLYDKGSVFLSRTGGDKEDLMDEYMRRIDYNAEIHRFVLEQLEIYKDLVRRGKMNGYKISDWIRMELWKEVAAYIRQGTSTRDVNENI